MICKAVLELIWLLPSLLKVCALPLRPCPRLVYPVFRLNAEGSRLAEVLMRPVTDYRHCIETQDRRPEGSKTASTPPYILIADRYYLQITVPISAIYYPIISYYPHLLRVYIEALELHLQSSRSCIPTLCKVYTTSIYRASRAAAAALNS